MASQVSFVKAPTPDLVARVRALVDAQEPTGELVDSALKAIYALGPRQLAAELGKGEPLPEDFPQLELAAYSRIADYHLAEASAYAAGKPYVQDSSGTSYDRLSQSPADQQIHLARFFAKEAGRNIEAEVMAINSSHRLEASPPTVGPPPFENGDDEDESEQASELDSEE